MTIQLVKNGEVILFDSEDWALVVRHRWRINRKKKYVRAAIHQKRPLPQINVFLHRLIMGLGRGRTVQVDHINRNPLDNRRINLRLASNSQNNSNRNQSNKRVNPSGYRGVYSYPNKSGKKRIISKITVNNKTIPLGYNFSSELEAAIAYNEAAIKYFGEFATLNKI